MSISRPLLLALLGALLTGATFFTTLNARERAADDPSPVAQTQQAVEGAQPADQLSPNEALRSAFSFDGLESARFAGTLDISASGPKGESARIEARGAFQTGAEGEIPKLDVDVRLRGLAQGLDAGFVSLGERAYFTRGDTGYEIPRDVWQEVVRSRRQGAATGASATPLPVDPASWLRDVESERGERVDGVETVHVSGSVDPARAVRDLVQASAQASGQGAGAPGTAALPPGIDGIVAQAVKRADFDLFVGADDRILRRASFVLDMALPRELRPATGVDGMKVKLDLELSDVNRPQTIERPARVSRTAPGGAFGEFSRGFAQGISLATGASAEDLAVPTNDNPRRLQRAVRQNRKVVLFFHQPGALDDQATAEAVRALGRRRGVMVLRDQVSNVDRYGTLVEQLGVNQAPAIVIVDSRGDAKLIEGYVDTQLLAQEVADAR